MTVYHSTYYCLLIIVWADESYEFQYNKYTTASSFSSLYIALSPLKYTLIVQYKSEALIIENFHIIYSGFPATGHFISASCCSISPLGNKINAPDLYNTVLGFFLTVQSPSVPEYRNF